VKHFSILRASMPLGSIECHEVADLPGSPEYVLRDEEGKLFGILSLAPGVTVVQSSPRQATVETKS